MPRRPSIKETHDAFLREACERLGYDETTYQVLLIAAREMRVELRIGSTRGRSGFR